MVWLCKTKIWGKSFILYIRTDDIYKDIAEDVETRFDTSNCVLDATSLADDYQKKKRKK